MKRKTMALLLALSMCLSLLTACGSGNTATDEKPPESENAASSTGQQPDESKQPEESEEQPEESEEPTQEPEQEEAKEEETEESEKPEAAVPAEMTYTFDAATGTLTCSGGGTISWREWIEVVKNTLFETDDKVCRSEVKKVVIEQGVTSIGSKAFEDCGNLVEVVIPDSVTTIESHAFDSTSLNSVNLPDSITRMDSGVFNECKSLSSVNLPSQITEISDGLFENCTNLTSIQIPEGVTQIGVDAFRGCSLTEIAIPDSVTSISANAFGSCPLTEVTIPKNVTDFTAEAFNGCPLTDITFLCEATMDNVQDYLVPWLEMEYPITIHAPAGSVYEGYINRLLDTNRAQWTFVPIN